MMWPYNESLASDFGVSVALVKLSGKVFDTSKAIGLSAEGCNLFGTLMKTADLSAEQAESLARSISTGKTRRCCPVC